METLNSEKQDLNIKVKGLTVCYDDYGSGDLPLIFIHGFPFDKSMWRNQLVYIKSSIRAIAYDIRGYGKSDPGKEKASIELYADDLINFMNVLKINKAIVCGLSMGGYILLNAINRFPDRFQAIVLCDTQCIADSPEGKEKRYKTIESIERYGINEFTEGFIKNVFFEESLIHKKEEVNKIRNTILATPVETITGTLKALSERKETCEVLNKIKIPVLILCGHEDRITPPIQSENLRDNIPNSRLFLISKAGHLSNIEQADEFNRHLIHFISVASI
jgi:3-oxoadipate enol-lactonase